MLKYGDKGKEVYDLQNKLNLILGDEMTIQPDGDFGRMTEDAVEMFQMKKFVTGSVSDYLMKVIDQDYQKALELEDVESVELPKKGLPKNVILQDFDYNQRKDLGNILWEPTGNRSSRKGYDPVAIVLHYTVSTSFEGTISWFKKTNHKAVSSSHLIVDYDGTVCKMVNFGDCAWHAGGTTLPDGYQLTNQRSIGIEIEGFGKLRKEGGKYLHPWANVEYDSEAYGKPFQDENGEYWSRYTPEQISVTKELCKVLLEAYPSIKYIVGHEDIAKHADGRKWKFDPGPAFPMKEFQELVKES
jgi:N-acetylmuramoyl-L-alanine amidase